MLPDLQEQLHSACCEEGDLEQVAVLHARKTHRLTMPKHTPTEQPPAIHHQMDSNEQNVLHFRSR